MQLEDLYKFNALNNFENTPIQFNTQYNYEYFADYNETENTYILRDYDHSKFYSYGMIKDKILSIKEEEFLYLNQIGLVGLSEFSTKQVIREFDVSKFFLYSHLKRHGLLIR